MEFFKTGLEKQTSAIESTTTEDTATNDVTERTKTEETVKPDDSANKEIGQIPVPTEAPKVPEKTESATENKAPTEV